VESQFPSVSELGPPSFRIAHLSDIHFGKISHPAVVPALIEQVNEGGFDVVVISGDLTQRAREREYVPAKAMIDSFEPQVVVVPGNHDVPPWWRPVDRLTDSGGPFREYISDDPIPRLTIDGHGDRLAVFGLDSSHGMSIAGGRIRSRHVDAMTEFFEMQPADSFRVLTVHHQLTRVLELGPHDVARGARRALRRAASAGVELILCGHLHLSHVRHIDLDIEDGHRIVVASAGTSTSSRGRRSNRNVNFYNSICVWPGYFTIEERRFTPDTLAFEPSRLTPFERIAVPSEV
jgi:3',5'-cyclic AMP phosphodiesterase CpdA